MSATAVLEVDDLQVHYGLARALSGVSLRVERGGALAVLGANGAGKTTLARAISGLVPPRKGQVVVDGDNVTGWAPYRIARAGVMHVPAERLVLPGLSVLDNLRTAVRFACPRAERRAALDRALTIFPRLGERRDQIAGTLSGGEQQMLSLARALAVPPALLIADELSHGLAPIVVEQVFDGLRTARAEGVAMIVVEQFVGAALGLTDQAVILRRGEVVWSGASSGAAARLEEHYMH